MAKYSILRISDECTWGMRYAPDGTPINYHAACNGYDRHEDQPGRHFRCQCYCHKTK
jgi:hypothetical protein